MAAHGVPEPGTEASTLRHLSPDELEFLAGDELVEVVPSESHAQLHFLGTYGPLVAGERATVPLWLAIMLKRRNKARLVCPEWMKVRSLEAALAAERREDAFVGLPYHYMEIASQLLSAAPDDMGDKDVDRVHMLLRDVETVRQGKIYRGMGAAAQQLDAAIRVNGIGAMELLPVRTFFGTALAQMYDISGNKSRAEAARAAAAAAVAAGDAVGAAGAFDGAAAAAAAAAPPPPLQTKRLRRFRA